MNVFYKMYCRTFQAVLKQLIKLMPWRKPELLRFEKAKEKADMERLRQQRVGFIPGA